MQSYEVVILGFRLNAPEPPEQALMRVFRIDENTARKVMRRFPVVVKRGIPLTLARTFEQALLEIGARVELREQAAPDAVRSAAVKVGSSPTPSREPSWSPGPPASAMGSSSLPPSLPPPPGPASTPIAPGSARPQHGILPPAGASPPSAAGLSNRPQRVIVPPAVISAMQSAHPSHAPQTAHSTPAAAVPPAERPSTFAAGRAPQQSDASALGPRRLEPDPSSRTSWSPLREQLFELDEDAAIPEIDTSALRHSSHPPRYSARALEYAFQNHAEPSASDPAAVATPSSPPQGAQVSAESTRPSAPVSGSAPSDQTGRTTRYGADLELPWIPPRSSIPPARGK